MISHSRPATAYATPTRQARSKPYSVPPHGPVLHHPSELRRLSLTGIPRGRGKSAAAIVWMYLCAGLKTNGYSRAVTRSMDSIVLATGLSKRSVQYGLRKLETMGKITWVWGRRNEHFQMPRTFTLHFGDGPNPRVFFPFPGHMRRIWALAKTKRKRPASIVALAVAAYAWAAVTDRPTEDAACKIPLTVLRELTGASHGNAFAKRLAALEAATIFRRAGEHWRHGIVVVIDLPRVVTGEPSPTETVVCEATEPSSLETPAWLDDVPLPTEADYEACCTGTDPPYS